MLTYLCYCVSQKCVNHCFGTPFSCAMLVSNSACCKEFVPVVKCCSLGKIWNPPKSPKAGESCLEEVQNGAPLIVTRFTTKINQGYNSTFCRPYHPWDSVYIQGGRLWPYLPFGRLWPSGIIFTYYMYVGKYAIPIIWLWGGVVKQPPGRAVPGPNHSDPPGDLASGRRGEGERPAGAVKGGAQSRSVSRWSLEDGDPIASMVYLVYFPYMNSWFFSMVQMSVNTPIHGCDELSMYFLSLDIQSYLLRFGVLGMFLGSKYLLKRCLDV